MIRTARTSTRFRRCDACEPPRTINIGDRYLSVAIPPRSHDIFYFDGWVRLAECDVCARHNGHGHLLDGAA